MRNTDITHNNVRNICSTLHDTHTLSNTYKQTYTQIHRRQEKQLIMKAK